MSQYISQFFYLHLSSKNNCLYLVYLFTYHIFNTCLLKTYRLDPCPLRTYSPYHFHFTFRVTIPPPCDKGKCHLHFWDAKRIISSVNMKSWTCKKYTFLSLVLINSILTPNLHLARPGGNSLRHYWQCVILEKKNRGRNWHLAYPGYPVILTEQAHCGPWRYGGPLLLLDSWCLESHLTGWLRGIPSKPLQLSRVPPWSQAWVCNKGKASQVLETSPHSLPSLLRTQGIIWFFSLAIPKEERDTDFQQLLFSHSQNFLNLWFPDSLKA